ncbi:MAG: hypothetical protein NDJ89_01080 [Oligoflexia bacterium]|nr:hypothetical protein [Oligoflexia bacterium]
MSTWVIVSWVAVLLLTVLNIVVFLKLKQASEQMMKMAFPGAKNMNEAVASMQQMMQGMQGMGGMGARGGRPAPKGGANMDAQLKAAMDMLQQMPKKGGKR